MSDFHNDAHTDNSHVLEVDAPSDSSISNFFSHALAAVKHAAGLVYHDVMAVEADVTKWEAENPQLEAILDSGVQYAEDLLGRFGVPVGPLKIVGTDILAALKGWAIADSTVTSGGVPVVPQAPATLVVQNAGGSTGGPSVDQIRQATQPAHLDQNTKGVQ